MWTLQCSQKRHKIGPKIDTPKCPPPAFPPPGSNPQRVSGWMGPPPSPGSENNSDPPLQQQNSPVFTPSQPPGTGKAQNSWSQFQRLEKKLLSFSETPPLSSQRQTSSLFARGASSSNGIRVVFLLILAAAFNRFFKVWGSGLRLK